MMKNETMRIREVMKVTGLPRSTIYRYIAKGIFPRQISLGPRTVAWLVAEIEEWVENRKKAREV